jgi:hypothetical protein
LLTEKFGESPSGKAGAFEAPIRRFDPFLPNKFMQQKTLDGLKWIATILNRINAPYRVGGGMATHLYGSGRPVGDIDISLSGKHFPAIVPLVQNFIIAGPKHYLNEKWDCTTLSLNYHGQDIDLTDVDTLLMRDNKDTKWIQNKEIYEKYSDVTMEIDGIRVNLMNPRVLLEYKQELSGEHQDFDKKFLEDYIESN